jgi:CheY-like chemotaxis protein
MNGRVLAETIRAERPHLPVLFTTGYTPDAIFNVSAEDGMALLGKPFTSAALIAKVSDLLKARDRSGAFVAAS